MSELKDDLVLSRAIKSSHHMLENDASVKDMDAAAIAWSAEVWGTLS